MHELCTRCTALPAGCKLFYILIFFFFLLIKHGIKKIKKKYNETLLNTKRLNSETRRFKRAEDEYEITNEIQIIQRLDFNFQILKVED